ncbi:MAG: hypothetical protein AAFX87_08795 [Bacteroidota bacterium]
MEYSSFLSRVLLMSTLIIASVAFINYKVDLYGLFDDTTDRSIEVYTNERTSKYLLSFRYIPENFEGIILGPSLSANLNTEQIEQFKVYNASIMGANISELRYLVENIVQKGNLRFAIICLDPYLTKDHGKKSAMIDPKEYYGALGSTNLFRTYLFKAVREWEIAPHKFPKGIINSYGFNNFNLYMADGNPEEKIMQKVRENAPESTKIDPLALQELEQTVDYLRSNDIKVFAYFTPVPRQILEINKQQYQAYQQQIYSAFQKEDIIIDLNTDQYARYTEDFNTFIDHGHLSEKGQAFVLDELNELLEQHLTTKNERISER